jgi:hypothetical protein
MLIPAYYDAPDHQEGSILMRGDDPRHESMFSYVTPEKRVRADQRQRLSPTAITTVGSSSSGSNK